MKSSVVASALLLSTTSLLSLAAPLAPRAPDSTAVDLTITQFAGLLEHLEQEFYIQSLAKFHPDDFVKAGFLNGDIPDEQLDDILKDESTHVTTLDAVIRSMKAEPLGAQCKFDFTAALTDVDSMIKTARVLELVGAGAYEGGALLITSNDVLTAAGTILGIEARLASILNTFDRGDFSPAPFEVALTPESVLSLAAPFVVGGCDVSKLGIVPQPTFSFNFTAKDGQHELEVGSFLTFASGDKVVLQEGFCQIIAGEINKAIVLPIKECIIPEQVSGPFFVYITKTDAPIPVSAAQQLLVPADQRDIIAGPAVGFVDPEHVQALVAAIRHEHEF